LSDALFVAGFSPEEPENVENWLAGIDGGAVALRVEVFRDHRLVERLRRLRPEAVVIGLLTDHTVAGYLAALSSGVSSAAPWDSMPELIVKVLTSSIEHYTLLPSLVVRALVDRGGPAEEGNGRST